MGSWDEFLTLDADAQVARLVEVMAEVVAEAGEDYVFYSTTHSRCVYVFNDKPACLVGRVLHRLGVSLDMLGAMDSCDDSSIERAARLLGRDLKVPAVRLLHDVQIMQDGGQPWGVCLAHARRFEEVGAEG